MKVNFVDKEAFDDEEFVYVKHNRFTHVRYAIEAVNLTKEETKSLELSTTLNGIIAAAGIPGIVSAVITICILLYVLVASASGQSIEDNVWKAFFAALAFYFGMERPRTSFD